MIVKEHNKHENVNSHLGWSNKKGSTVKVKPKEIKFHLLTAKWPRFKPYIGA
jgi:hypothetical protein